jgi:papain fold toxin 1 (glutamine deamidase) of polymorphic toxin system
VTVSGDQISLDLDQLPGMVRAIGDRARDAQGAAGDARDLVSRVDGLPGSARRASGLVADAQRLIDRAQSELFTLQKDAASRLEEIARSEGYPDLVKALRDATKPPPTHHWWQTFTDPFEDALKAGWHFISHNPLEAIHTGLDVLGFIPVVGDVANGLNALIYLGQGDYADAALSAVALIPVAGSAAVAARLATKGARVIKDASEAERVVTDATRVASDVSHVTNDATRVAGDARGIEDAASVADEAAGYSARDVNPGYPGPGRTMNCVNCSVATDATLRGAPAMALPSTAPKTLGDLERHFGASFAPMASRQEIEDTMRQAGDGSLGIVAGTRGPGRVGHVFNVANQGGKINFVDGQIGGEGSTSGFVRLYLLRTR